MISLLRTTFLLLMIISNLVCASQTCENVDHSSMLGPTRYQVGTNNWCWAYAASDALSFALELDPSEQISLVDYAVKAISSDPLMFSDFFTAVSPASIIQTNHIEEFINYHNLQRYDPTQSIEMHMAMIASGLASVSNSSYVCVEKNISENDLHLGESLNQHLKRRFGYDYTSKVRTKLIEIGLISGLNLDDVRILDQAKNISELNSIASILNIKLSQADLSDLLKYKEIDLNQLKSKINNQCSEKKPTRSVFLWYKHYPPGHPNILTKSAELKEFIGSTPVIVTIDNSSFKNSKQKGYPNHFALVVGSKFNEKKQVCEYKVRNTLKCSEYVSESIRKRCSNGNIWLTEDDLLSLTYEMTVVMKTHGKKD